MIGPVKLIGPGLRLWLFVLMVVFLIHGLGLIFAQGPLFSLYGALPLEPAALRVLGGVDVALAYLFFQGYLSRKVDVVKPILEMVMFLCVISMLVGFFNFKVVNIYPPHLIYIWEAASVLILAITLILYRKNVS